MAEAAKQKKKQYFEKYIDPTYNIPYYYDPYTQQSQWEAPGEGAIVADMTIGQEKKPSAKELKKQEEEEKKRAEYRRKQQEIARL